MHHPTSLGTIIIFLHIIINAGACGRSGGDEAPVASEKPAGNPGRSIDIHHVFDLPIITRGVRPAGVSVNDTVWALLPYPSDPRKFRLALGTLVAVDDAGATIENSGSITGSIPWSVVRVRSRAAVKPGQAVLAAGAAGLFAGRVAATDKVASLSGEQVEVDRLWRLEVRRDPVPAADLLVQDGTRDYGRIVFFQDRGMWQQGIWIISEERHAWVVQGLGGAVIRVSSVETQPWKPDFIPVQGQEVEACRSGASQLVRATIFKAPAHGLFFEIRLSSGAIRTRVPFWEILPQGSVL